MRRAVILCGAVLLLAACGEVGELPSDHVTQELCASRPDGTFCDGDLLKTCAGGTESASTLCELGCLDGPTPACRTAPPVVTTFCTGKADSKYCDGTELVTCAGEQVAQQEHCANGCEAGACKAPPATCPTTPPKASTAPPSSACNYMDWNLEVDGFYLVSQFGTDADSTTMGRTTTCGYLQSHYNYRSCIYDNLQKKCLPGDHKIPWVTGTVDYSKSAMLAEVDAHIDGDVPTSKYFYVACAQRFGCGATLRVTNPNNGRCVVVFAEDGGPGTTYEYAGKGGRRILDSSPAVHRYLKTSCCWSSNQLVLVEWGLPGDVPGHKCTPCQSTPVKQGTEAKRPPWDVNHMMPTSCR